MLFFVLFVTLLSVEWLLRGAGEWCELIRLTSGAVPQLAAPVW